MTATCYLSIETIHKRFEILNWYMQVRTVLLIKQILSVNFSVTLINLWKRRTYYCLHSYGESTMHSKKYRTTIQSSLKRLFGISINKWSNIKWLVSTAYLQIWWKTSSDIAKSLSFTISLTLKTAIIFYWLENSSSGSTSLIVR